MTTYVNAGAYPVHVGGLSVGVNATVTRLEPLEDDHPYDREGVSVVLFPGDAVDTDVELVTGSLVELDDTVPADPPTAAPKPRASKKKSPDAEASTDPAPTAPTETE